MKGAANALRAAQILDRGKINEIFAALVEPSQIQLVLLVDALIIVHIIGRGIFYHKRIILSILACSEYLAKILAPAATNHGAMRYDNNTSEGRTAHNFKRSQSLAKAHFGIPQHFALLFEAFQRLYNGILLLLTESNAGRFCFDFRGKEYRPSFFHRTYCIFGGDQIHSEPFVAAGAVGLDLFLTRIEQYGMNILIAKAGKGYGISVFYLAECQFGVFQLIGNACGSGITFDSCFSCRIQCITVGHQCGGICRGGDGRFTNFEQPFMHFVIDRKDVNQLIFCC